MGFDPLVIEQVICAVVLGMLEQMAPLPNSSQELLGPSTDL